MTSTSVVSAIIVILAAVLVWRHGQEARHGRAADDPQSRRFARIQSNRRMRTNGLLGFAGVWMYATQFIESPVWQAISWLTLMVLAVSIAILALVDWSATQRQLRDEAAQLLVAQATLRAELARLRSAEGNGAADLGIIRPQVDRNAGPI